MTQENKMKFVLLFLVLSLHLSVFAEFSKSSILSNEMYSVSGNCDTLFVNTSHGVNYTINLSSDIVNWMGDESLLLDKIIYVNGKAIFIAPGDEKYLNTFSIFTESSGYSTPTALPFKLSEFENAGNDINTDFYFVIQDAVDKDSSLWFACFDGGVVRYDSDVDIDTYIPNDSKSYFPSAINKTIIPKPDKEKRVVSIASAGSKKLWVGALNNLWLLDYSQDSVVLWDSIGFVNDTVNSGIESISEVYSDPIDSNNVIVMVDYIVNQDENYSGSAAYLYNRVNNIWKRIGTDKYLSLTLGKGRDLFLASFSERDKIYRYEYNNGSYVLAVDGDDFKTRLNKTIGAPLGYQINDINFSSNSSIEMLVIATSKGLFYSENEYADEASSTAFKFTKRSVQLKKGLEQTYSYPSIITGDSDFGKDKAYFAYNLSKDGKVTIDIYDFNMDHVVKIIDEAPRSAGDKNPSGRSTIEAQDYWDGTARNDGGTSVPPGIYYYRIKSDKGEKAFGKVIVAKN